MTGTEPESQSVESLRRKIDTIKAEVDALQIAQMEKKTPWYKSVPTIISLLALLFSFGTTLVSYNRTKSQDMLALRAELRGMLQRLASLPKENYELTKTYQQEPASAAALSGYVNQENLLLARQAAEIVLKLPKEQVSATEYYAVGQALVMSNELERAKALIGRAISASNDVNDEVAATRVNANLLFMTGQPEAGRIEYQKALGIFTKYPGYNDWTQKTYHIYTEQLWAISEASTGGVSVALSHIAAAEDLAKQLPPSPNSEQLKRQTQQYREVIQAGESLKLTPQAQP